MIGSSCLVLWFELTIAQYFSCLALTFCFSLDIIFGASLLRAIGSMPSSSRATVFSLWKQYKQDVDSKTNLGKVVAGQGGLWQWGCKGTGSLKWPIFCVTVELSYFSLKLPAVTWVMLIEFGGVLVWYTWGGSSSGDSSTSSLFLFGFLSMWPPPRALGRTIALYTEVLKCDIWTILFENFYSNQKPSGH